MAICVALAPMASTGPAAAARQDKLIGLLSLPEVFGAGACDKFTPAAVPLLRNSRLRPDRGFHTRRPVLDVP